MPRPKLRQMRNWFFAAVVMLALSCVSRTSPVGRLEQSLSVADDSLTATVADPDSFIFALTGDLHIAGGDTSRLRTMLDMAQSDGAEFFVFLGDIVDDGKRSDVEAFHQAISDKGWTGKTFSIAGNHDIFEDGWDNFLELTGPSTYTFTAGNSKFIALDTADATLGARQLSWLRDRLDEATEQNVFLVSHYLPVIPDQQTYLKFASETESLDLMSLASRKGVRAWWGAHYHSFIEKEIGQVLYTVAGGGGARRMAPVRDFFYVKVQVQGTTVTNELRLTGW